MSQHDQDHDAIALPGGRMGRLLRLGGMTSGLVGDMAVAGLRQVARGQRPRMQQMILTRLCCTNQVIGRLPPFPRQTYPTTSVTGMPSAV